MPNLGDKPTDDMEKTRILPDDDEVTDMDEALKEDDTDIEDEADEEPDSELEETE